MIPEIFWLTQKLDAVQKARWRAWRQAEDAWRAFYEAVDEAERGPMDPETGGMPEETLSWLNELAKTAELLEARARRLWDKEQKLAGQILSWKAAPAQWMKEGVTA